MKVALVLSGLIFGLLVGMMLPVQAASSWQLGDPLPMVFSQGKGMDCDDATLHEYLTLFWLAGKVRILEERLVPGKQPHSWVLAYSANDTPYAYDYGYYRIEPEFYSGHEISYCQLLMYALRDKE